MPLVCQLSVSGFCLDLSKQMRSILGMGNMEWCTRVMFKVVMAIIRTSTTVINSRCQVQTSITQVMARPVSPMHPAEGSMGADTVLANLQFRRRLQITRTTTTVSRRIRIIHGILGITCSAIIRATK